eukprot:1140267-Pelagomonas_calceolata.AAC.9
MICQVGIAKETRIIRIEQVHNTTTQSEEVQPSRAAKQHREAKGASLQQKRRLMICLPTAPCALDAD